MPDLDLRMGLYRRLGELEDRPAIDAFAAELIDRFGALPDETANLMKIVEVKLNCRSRRCIAKLDIGAEGRGGDLRRRRLPRPRRAARLHRAAEGRGQAQARQQDDGLARLADARGAAQRRAAALARPGAGRRRRQKRRRRSWSRPSSASRTCRRTGSCGRGSTCRTPGCRAGRRGFRAPCFRPRI